MGADVTVIARSKGGEVSRRLGGAGDNPLRCGKRVLPPDLKQATELIAASDALLEGNRPGVMERLGLGPAQCAARNPRLVYGRMTGWGQSGPLAQTAGHDLNYVALDELICTSTLAEHDRSGTAIVSTIRGHRKYLEHDWS